MVNGAIIESPEDIDELLTANGYLDAHFVFVQAKRSSKFEGGEMARSPTSTSAGTSTGIQTPSR
jgi:hypothetical protein